MSIHALAGKPAPPDILIDVDALVAQYFDRRPDVADPLQLVSFGTSGHRGSSADGTFNEAHILATTQAICEYRAAQGFTGPVLIGMDTHALSGPAQRTALEVLAANGVEVWFQRDDGFTPTPVISHAILCFNRGRTTGLADGIVVTPSHNPPRDGGFKYNPPNGGPAIPTSRPGFRIGPTRCCALTTPACAVSRTRRPSQSGRAGARLRAAVRRRPGPRRRPRHRAGGWCAVGCRSARRR